MIHTHSSITQWYLAENEIQVIMPPTPPRLDCEAWWNVGANSLSIDLGTLRLV
jgi:hypothetical protein